MTTQRAELHNTAQQRTPSAQHVTDTAAPHVAHGMPAFTDSQAETPARCKQWLSFTVVRACWRSANKLQH